MAYLITNVVTNQRYVGITSKGVWRRWRAHVAKSKNGSKTLLHYAIREYGVSSFIVEELSCSVDMESLRLTEQELIRQFNTISPSGYNLTVGGQGCLGYKFTNAQLKRLSESHIGFRHSKETRERIAKASAGRLHSVDTKRKMSAMKKLQYENPAERAKAAARLSAYISSPAGRKKMKQNFDALMMKPEFLKKWRKDRTGQKRSDQSKDRMRAARNKFLLNDPDRARELTGKLATEQVRQIKTLLANGVSQTSIAKQFGVRQTQISNIKRGLCWRGVEPLIARVTLNAA